MLALKKWKHEENRLEIMMTHVRYEVMNYASECHVLPQKMNIN